MHEGRRTERRLAGITKVEKRAKIDVELLRVTERQFAKQIVRMLPIVQRLTVPRLAGLKEKRITAPAFGEQIETHHRAQTELCGIAERMRIHAHDPVGRVACSRWCNAEKSRRAT